MLAPGLNRRAFLTGLGCIGVTASLPANDRLLGVRRVSEYSGSGIALPAVAAARMPETLVIEHGKEEFLERLGRSRYVEFRRYAFERPETFVEIQRALTRFGIYPLVAGPDGIFLFGFATLAHREKIWRELCAEPEWRKLGPQLGELSIYKVA